MKLRKLLFLLFLPTLSFAQSGDFTLGLLGEYSNLTMMVGEKKDLHIFEGDSHKEAGVIGEGLSVTINGNAIDHQNPDDGTLHVGLDGKLTYEAPRHIPQRNPVAIAVSFISPKDHKTKIFLVANITIEAGYKLSLTMQTTVKDVSFACTGTAFLRAKQQADGSYLLVPLHGDNVMHVTITEYKMPKAKYISPYGYDTPLFITVSSDKADPQCTVNFQPINNIPQTFESDGHEGTMSLQEPFLNYLNTIFLSDPGGIKGRIGQNIDEDKQKLAWAQRMQAHKGDAAYKNTSQGKADMAQMQKIREEMMAAHGMGSSKLMQSMENLQGRFHFKSDQAFSLEQGVAKVVSGAATGNLKVQITYMK